MSDRDRLREALRLWSAGENYSAYSNLIKEAARLVASPDTLIVEKVNGEWPTVHDSDGYSRCCGLLGTHALKHHRPGCPLVTILDALLAYQTGDTE